MIRVKVKKILANKVAIITGANQGLGLEIAKKYAASGASLMLCARNELLLGSAIEEVRKYISKDQIVLSKQADVSNLQDVRGVIDSTISQIGGCHILVNNAGIYGPMGDIESIDWSEWIKAIEINLYGPILMCRELIPYFKSQHQGKIIQLSGGGATNPMPKLVLTQYPKQLLFVSLKRWLRK